MNTIINNEIIDWDIVEESEFILSEEDKNIEQKNLTKQDKYEHETNPDNVEELVTCIDIEESYIVEKEEQEPEQEQEQEPEQEQEQEQEPEQEPEQEQESIKKITNNANGDVVITFNKQACNLRHRNIKKRKRKKKRKQKRKQKSKKQFRKQRGKEIFMIIKMDQWASVHPESLDSETEMEEVRKLLNFIWSEMHSSEKYAYFKYLEIDEKYKKAKTNNVCKNVLNFFDNIVNNIGNFFDNLLICLEDNNEKNYYNPKKI